MPPGGRDRSIEAILPLFPLQEGLLFHSVISSQEGAFNQYVAQVEISIVNLCDIEDLKAACAVVVERHEALRSTFHWWDLKRPAQVIHKSSLFQWQFSSFVDSPDLAEAMRLVLSGEREAVGQTDQLPLIRFFLIEVAPESYILLVTIHHLVVDGWSVVNVVREISALMNSSRRDSLPDPPRLVDYAKWLYSTDQSRALEFWSNYCANMSTNPSLLEGELVGDEHSTMIEAALSVAATEELRNAAKRHRVTLASVISACWGRALQVLGKGEDVMFGTVMSLRPAAVTNSELLVGLLTNTVPTRTSWSMMDSVLDQATVLQNSFAARTEYATVSLSNIQRITRRRYLFDSVVSVENFPRLDFGEIGGRGKSPWISGFKVVDTTHYPLALTARWTEVLQFRVEYQPGKVGDILAHAVLGRLVELIATAV